MKTKLLLLMICGFMLPLLSYGQSCGAADQTDINFNVGLGDAVFYNCTAITGSRNSGFGDLALSCQSMYYNTSGNSNVAIGTQALLNNTAASMNVAVGDSALVNNTTGEYNVAVGFQTLIGLTNGGYNDAVGYQALQTNAGGIFNDAFGVQALSLTLKVIMMHLAILLWLTMKQVVIMLL